MCSPCCSALGLIQKKVEETKLGLKTRVEAVAWLGHPSSFPSCLACCLLFPFSDSLSTVSHPKDFQEVGGRKEEKEKYMIISNA